ncbi:MAG: tRNA(His) guanylyltransferase Thg1 family protein [Candidatus Bathyarchaeia archaeon]
MNSYESLVKNEIFSKTSVPHGTNFFVRLDGWKFKRLSEIVGAEKPFDERFAKCMVNAGRALFEKGFNPALIYVASDELNILFLDSQPFRGRVEKIDSVIASLVSAVFALQLQKVFGKTDGTAFDSRIAIVPTENAVVNYLAWRQANAWRNHNNAYAYWLLRKMGYLPLETAKKLEGMKTEEIHETLFKHGINLAETPAWQRRGTLLYKKPASKKTEKWRVIRWKIEENWDLPLFTKEDGAKLIHQILEWFKAKGRS